MLRLFARAIITSSMLFAFLFINSCSSYFPVQHNASELKGANTYELFKKGQIALLMVDEKDCTFTRLAIDSKTVYSPNVDKKRQWTITLLPGKHQIDFDIDVQIDKKSKYYSSIKKITSSFIAKGGSAYKLVSKQKGVFYWEPEVIESFSYKY